MFLLCFYGPVLYKWPLNWRWQIIAMCAHGAQEEKTCLHLVSSSFERWTLSVDLQCVFHSGSRHIQIRCNFFSLVPSVQQIDVSGNDIGGEGVLQGVRLPNCVLKICIFSQKVLCKVSSSKSFVTWTSNNMVFVKFFMGSYRVYIFWEHSVLQKWK